MQTQLTQKQIKEIMFKELPKLFKKDKEIHRYILEITKEKYAEKEKTEDRIDRILDELKRDREKDEKKWESQEKKWDVQEKKWESWEKKWEESRREDQKKWETQEERWKANEERWKSWEKKWEENQKVINEMLNDIRKLDKKHDATIGALGARWGLHSEAAFRNGLKAILEKSFDVRVENYSDFDNDGIIFGRPDQVEVDVIIFDGQTILCELKSSMSKPQVYTFWRKKEFYEKMHNRNVSRMIIISPMIDENARSFAKDLGIETYGYADDAKFFTDKDIPV